MAARSVRRRAAAAAIVLVGAALLGAAPTASGSAVVDAAGPQHATEQPGMPAGFTSVTLITGDVARVFRRPNGDHAVTMLPPAGSAVGRSYTGYVDGAGDHHVIPSDVLPLLGDWLDPRLFNVSALVRDGYDDAARAWLPVIVEHGDAPFTLPGGSVVRALPSVGASAVRLDRNSAADLGAALGRAARSSSFLTGVDKIWLDGRVRASLDESVPQIGAPDAWAAGYDGTGTRIAILDSGIDTDHADIGDRVVAAEDFGFSGTTDDVLGHGTYTASIAAGTGAASDGQFTGVAYGADLVNAKVLDDAGYGEESSVIAGMEWAAIDQDVDVVNISVNGPPTDGSDLMSLAINVLSASEDVLFVVSAGNEGFGGPGSIATPATADAALAVGAVDKSDVIADFSAMGSRIGDFAVKPEIAAPGVAITAARIPGTPFGDPVGEDYLEWSGTSAAAPHVAGAAALVRQARPDLTWSEVKAVLTTSAVDVGASVYAQGGGRVDVPAALAQAVRSAESTANLGVLEYPHDDGETATADVTLINSGETEVTLDLAAAATNEDGDPAPPAMLTVGPAALTLAPGESGTATVTIDPSTGPIGLYGGYLTASSGAELLHVPLGFEKEAEAYDLTIELADRRGGTDYSGWLGLVELSADRFLEVVQVIGEASVVMRVPAGTYGATFQSMQGSEDIGSEIVDVTQPEFDVAADTTLTLDGRQATEITVEVPEPATQHLHSGLTTLRGSASDGSGYQIFNEAVGGPTWRLFAAPTEEATVGRLQFDSSFSMQGADRSYHLGFPEAGAIPPDLDYAVGPEDVAHVDLAMHADVTDLTYAAMILVATPSWLFSPGLVEIEGGSHHEAWFTAREDVGFLEVIGQKELFAVAELQYFTRDLQPGGAVGQRWFAQPARPGAPYGWPIAGRGDEFFAEMFLMDADGQFGYVDPGFEAPSIDDVHLKLQSGGEVIAESNDLFLGTELPPERATYELVLETARTADWWQMSTETRTLWRFESEAPPEGEAGPLPLLQVDYGVELDLLNRATSPAKIHFEAYRTGSASGAEPAEIASFDAWTSVNDGGTWTALDLTDLGEGSYEGTAEMPSTCVDPCLVTLRVAASDTEGNETEQMITRAFTITGSGQTPSPTVTPTLPPTGTASAPGVAVAGLAAVLAGGLLVVLAARRRASSTLR